MRQTLKINGGLFFAVFFWASAFVAIRIGLTSYSPGPLALFRFSIASVFMALIYARLSHRKKMLLMDRLQLLLLGVVGIGGYNFCLNVGEMTVSAGVASFIIGLMPVLTIMLSVIFLNERPTRAVFIGIMMSLLGLVMMLVAGSGAVSTRNGVLIIFMAACISAFYTLMQKRYLRLYHPVAVTTWIIWGGTLSLMVFSHTLWQEIGVARIEATWAVIYMGIFPAALAYLAWSYVLNTLSAATASMYLYGMPVISSVLGFLVLHERPSNLSLCGGVVAMLGACYATRKRFNQALLVK